MLDKREEILKIAAKHGAANILRKVATTSGLNLDGVGKGALTTPLRFRFWTLKESHAL